MDELLPLVAIRFFLYRETADYHRSKAEQLMNQLIQQQLPPSNNLLNVKSPTSSSVPKRESFGSSELNVSKQTTLYLFLSYHSIQSIVDQLTVIMYEFQEANSNYSKASSHQNAEHCSRKAQLVALQIVYMKQAQTLATNELTANSKQASVFVQFIINLDRVKVQEFVVQCRKYYEALIVTRAYSDVMVDWTDPFFNNVIIGTNQQYLIDYFQSEPISVFMLEQLIKRCDQLSKAYRSQLLDRVSPRALSSSPKVSHSPSQLSSSQSSVTLTSMLATVRHETDLSKHRLVLEQILTVALCKNMTGIEARLASSQSNVYLQHVPYLNCDLLDKYNLAKQFGSQKLLQLMVNQNDCDNFVYLRDLHRNKQLL